MKVLVTDGNNRASLAITRSLGRRGHQIYVGETKHPSLSSQSRYCTGTISYPDPKTDANAFVDYLAQQSVRLSFDVILPTTDITTLSILENRQKFPQSCAIPFSDKKALGLAADKAYIMQTAEQLGVAIPNSVLLRSKDDVNNHLSSLQYPVVIKPARSRIHDHKGWVSTQVSYADDQAALIKDLNSKQDNEFPVLLQERIVGPGVGVFACYDHGKLIAIFSHKRLREKPPSGGVSVLRESIEVDPTAKRFTQLLLDHLNWHGVAMVEFKLDLRDNTPKLMEINGRFWGSLQLAIDAGVDFPHLLLQTIEHSGEIEPLTRYRIGTKTRWLWGDIDRLLMLFLKSRKELNLPPGHHGKLASVLQFLKFWGKDLHYEILKINDIKPWLFETRNWFKKLING